MTDSVILITGAAGNLGRAVAATHAAHGARVALLDRDETALRDAFGPDTDRQLCLATDLLDDDATGRAVAAAHQHFGRIDGLCHLAGGFHMGDAVHDTSDATLDALLDLNVRTLVITARHVVPLMLTAGQGHIVTVGAFGAQRGSAAMGAYASSKAALQRLTESMSAELRHQGIRVNCVLPTVIDTPQNRAAMPDADPSQWVAPEALADVIAFLGSPAARAVHGAALPVTGLV